jgi:hypothetical protein
MQAKTPPLRAEQFEYLNYTQNYIILYNMRIYNYFIYIYYSNTQGILYKYYKELSWTVAL